MSGSAGEAERADELIAQFIGVTGSEFEDVCTLVKPMSSNFLADSIPGKRLSHGP
jgi:hypothetical protein